MPPTLETNQHPQADDTLPSPEQRPGSNVVIFDGRCGFCTSQARRLDRWDSRRCLSFLSLHDPRVARNFPDLSHEQLMEQLYLIDPCGRRYGGAAAFRYLSLRLPRLRPLAPLLHIPFSLPIWQWGYRQIAKRRYRLQAAEACPDDACKIHFH